MKKKKAQREVAKGLLRVHPRGFGFLVPEERGKFPLDIFIPPHATNHAVDGDTVEVVLSPEPVSEKGPEGWVSRILHRGRSHVGGTVLTVFDSGKALAHVPILGAKTQMRIDPSGKRKLKAGDRVVIHVSDWEKCTGKVSSYLGHITDPSCDIKAAIEEYEIDPEFSREAIQEAKVFGTKVASKDLKGRADLRGLECFTIDPETAKDFDDALSLEKTKEGNYALGVHIADVSFYVRPGSVLDKEAQERCNSIYFPGEVIPMLPHELSSHLCSLKPHVNRLAASVLMTFDPEGNLKHYEIVRSVIQSKKRFTYPEALDVLEKKRKSPHAAKLQLMVELCQLLKRKRSQRGCLEFSFPEIKLILDPKGMPLGVEIISYDITHQLVEEFMLKANEMVATHLGLLNKPLTYRIHQEPKQESMRDFTQVARSLGFKIHDPPSPEELQLLFDKARQTPFGQFLATAFIRSMKLASYSTQNVGHYGLGLEHYCHFTSPIRRYVDLIVHRILFDDSSLAEEELEEIALNCSEKERLSSKAENSVILLKKLRLLESLVKQNPHREFQGVITHVKPFGFAFEISELILEGFIFLGDMDLDDYFLFEERRKRLYGEWTGETFQTGDPIKVALEHVNLITQETKWFFIRKSKKKKKKNE